METMIEAGGLVKCFGAFRAVAGVSFRVAAGRVFAFLGPNGAGKTTTVKMLTTVLAPTSGAARVAGHDAAREPLAARRAFGIVFQDPSLDNELTALENLLVHGALYGVPARERRERAERLLAYVELSERRHDLVKRFSGGMARGLAREIALTGHALRDEEASAADELRQMSRLWGRRGR